MNSTGQGYYQPYETNQYESVQYPPVIQGPIIVNGYPQGYQNPTYIYPTNGPVIYSQPIQTSYVSGSPPLYNSRSFQPPPQPQSSYHGPIQPVNANPYQFSSHQPQGVVSSSQQYNQDPIQEFVNTAKESRGALSNYLRTSMMVSPFVYLTLIWLFFTILMGVLIIRKLDIQSELQQNTAALAVLGSQQSQITQNDLTDIKVKSGSCSDVWIDVILGDFSGVDSGCICPNLQTSTQSCSAGCSRVAATGQLQINQFTGVSLCVKYGKTNQLNHVETTTSSNDPNTIEIQNTKFKFTHNDHETMYFKFHVTPDNVCLNPLIGPSTLSGMSYPFFKKPNLGCDQYGTKELQMSKLGTANEYTVYGENTQTKSIIQLPYVQKYSNQNSDTLSLYIERKIYLSSNDQCKVSLFLLIMFFKYLRTINWPNIQSYCDVIRILVYILTNLIFFCFGLAIILYIMNYFAESKRKSNIELKHHYLDDTLKHSIIVLGILVAISVFFVSIFYFYVQYGSDGLSQNEIRITASIKAQCFINTGVNLAMKNVANLSETCTQSFGTRIEALFIGMIIFMVLLGLLAYYTVRSQRAQIRDRYKTQ